MFTNEKIATVSVINDLNSDVRVSKIVQALREEGYQVLLIGRKLPNSKAYVPQNHRALRMNMLFKKGPLFYLFFNLRLFFKLLVTKTDLLYANDLDTLLPNYLVAKIKKRPLIYDSHELFCEVPELLHTPIKRNIWLTLEGFIVPKLNNLITVSAGIAKFYDEKYHKHFEVVRNIPPSIALSSPAKTKLELGIDPNKKMILLQGAGINVDRGAEELIEAMPLVNDAVLYIIGSGDVWQQLEQKIKQLKLEAKVKMIHKLPKETLLQYTLLADVGLSIDKNTNLNYYYSLPNKLFDYIEAQLPVLASRLPEIENIIQQYNIGEFIESHAPTHIAQRLNDFLQSPHLSQYKNNMAAAKGDLNWQNEKQKLMAVIKKAANA